MDSEANAITRAVAGTRSARAMTSGASAAISDGVAPDPIATLDSPRSLRQAIKGAGYLSVCSRADQNETTTAVFTGSNRLGDVLLSTGVASVAASSLAVMTPVLPVAIAGLDVREALHRFDVNAYAPTLERGLSSTNSVGERLGTVAMRWLAAPDDFEAMPGKTPPSTALDPSRSQRFVMLDGRILFQDRRQGGVRFFGAGRTFPSIVGGRPRLEFAGVATVLEGVGSLKGLRGTLMVSGHLAPPNGIGLAVIARFDEHGPVQAEDWLSPLIDQRDPGGQSTMFTLVGEPDPDHPSELAVASDGCVVASHVTERLDAARIGNDLHHSQRLRSLIREGAAVGVVTGPLCFDPSDRRCSVRLRDSRRVLTFADPAGRRVGTINVDVLEGTAFKESWRGDSVYRVVAYGPLTDGTGVLSGVTGVMTMDSVISGLGETASIYSLRLADAEQRLRAAEPDVYRPPPADVASPQAGAEEMRFVDDRGTAAITETDKTIVSFAEKTLAEGLELARWWEEKDKVGDYREKFNLIREFNQDDRSFGFFDEAIVANRNLRVMGIVQEMFYDRQKQATGETIRPQLKEFILRYFMRVSHFRQPEAAPATGQRPPASYLRGLSWYPEDVEARVGFGYEQLYYKLRASGAIGKFRQHEKHAIVDLRDIGDKYDWIVLKVNIFDFNLVFAPLGYDAPKMVVPLKESTYLVLGPPFVKNTEKCEHGVIGQYGYGYAFLPYAPEPGPIAYGPGHFAAAIQTIDFKVMESGTITARAAFIVNRPNQVVKLDVDPIDWGFKLADLLTFNMASRIFGPVKELTDQLPLRITEVDPIAAYIWFTNAISGGLAAQQLGISLEQLEKKMLVQHFMQHYQMLINSLLMWRMINNWTDEPNLPDFCRLGIRS